MKTTRLFHTIVMVGASLTAPAGVTLLAAVAVPVAGCDSTPQAQTIIDMMRFSIIDMAFPTIEIDMAHFAIIDSGSRD